MPITLNGTTGVVTPGATIGSINGILKSSSGVVSQASVGTDYSQLTLATAQTASGTSVDFTGIPSWAKRVSMMLGGVSTSGTSNLILQIGSGSISSTGYSGAVTEASTSNYFSTSFQLRITTAASLTYSGVISLYLLGSNIYVVNGIIGISATHASAQIAGAVTLSNTLDRIRITTVNGTDTFDAGTINISYE